MAPLEARVAIQADTLTAAGNVRTLQITLVQPDGTLQTVLMQVVAIADKFGNILDVHEEQDWRKLVLTELRAIRLGIQDHINQGALPGEETDLFDRAIEFAEDVETEGA